MCQTTTQRTIVKTATEDIQVWKGIRKAWTNPTSGRSKVILNACNPAVYNSYLYRRGYSQKGKYQDRAFNDRVYRLKCAAPSFDIRLNGEGFHSFTRISEAIESVKSNQDKLGRFTIPKGARYIEGTDGGGRGTRVSTKIRFEGFMKC